MDELGAGVNSFLVGDVEEERVREVVLLRLYR